VEPVIGGSLASSIWGSPRQTRDVDLSVLAEKEALENAIRSLGDDFLASAEDVALALTERSPWSSFQILHIGEMFKFDIFVPGPDSFTESLRSRTSWVELDELRLRVASPEDILILKLRWYDLGNRVSDRQWNDIVQVVEVQGDRLDRKYVLQWARHFGLSKLAEQALSEAWPSQE
jgi:hypothetical protein